MRASTVLPEAYKSRDTRSTGVAGPEAGPATPEMLRRLMVLGPSGPGEARSVILPFESHPATSIKTHRTPTNHTTLASLAQSNFIRPPVQSGETTWVSRVGSAVCLYIRCQQHPL